MRAGWIGGPGKNGIRVGVMPVKTGIQDGRPPCAPTEFQDPRDGKLAVRARHKFA